MNSMLSPTARHALDAYGGADLWRTAPEVDAIVSAQGWAFRSKLRKPVRRFRVRLETARPHGRFSPSDRPAAVAVLDGHSVHLEDASGRILVRRLDGREGFPYGRRLFWWDRLDHAYFSLYALWNYLTHPALLLREDILWTELSQNVLQAEFPPHLPTHCRQQQFHYHPHTGLLRQHDYTAEVFGQWAKAANVVLEHQMWKGIPYPARRRITPRRPDGRPRRWPLLVDIRVHEWRLVGSGA